MICSECEVAVVEEPRIHNKCYPCIDKWVDDHWPCGCENDTHKNHDEYLACPDCDDFGKIYGGSNV